MRVLSSGWSAYSIWRTQDVGLRFSTLITDGACKVDLFPTYVKHRISFQVCVLMRSESIILNLLQIPDLVLNLVALVLSGFLVYRLVRVSPARVPP